MHIALVSAFPPSGGGLNEYAYHLVRHLAERPEVSRVTVIADVTGQAECYQLPKVEVVRAWRFGKPLSAYHILRTLRRIRPDVVWFNFSFSSFGADPFSAGFGALTPALARLAGFRVLVLLHWLVETSDVGEALGVESGLRRLMIQVGGPLLTRAILLADRVVVTLPRNLSILQERYGAKNAALIPHGAFESIDSRRETLADGPRVLLAFGKFGTYKRLEIVMDAYARLLKAGFECRLVVAGRDNPNAPGYLEHVAQRYSALPGVTFQGYVPEEQVRSLFSSAYAVIFPYTSTMGSSGVLHQAGGYGRAVVMPRIGDLAELIEFEGYDAEFFTPGDVDSLTDAIRRVLEDRDRASLMGKHNYRAAHALTMDVIVGRYMLQIQQILENRIS